MLKHRMIVALILRQGQVVQSIQFRHTNIIHAMASIAVDHFNRWAVDEMVVLDVTRNLDQRQRFYDTLDELSRKCFVPMTVGGWVTTIEEMRKLLRLAADKVIINTEAVRRPEFIRECAREFGSQSVVVSIDVRTNADGRHEVYVDRGRQATGLDPVDWSRQAQEFEAGEIYLTSIDHDGMRQGYDLELMRQVIEAVDIPVIAFGGASTWQHLVDGVIEAGADAVSAANVFHYTEHSAKKAKKFMRQAGIDVR